jgi:deoxyadenosine/deoxycytidine kinase
VRSTRPRYIAVRRADRVGNSCLAQILGEKLSARVILEQAHENPFLGDFYKDRRRPRDVDAALLPAAALPAAGESWRRAISSRATSSPTNVFAKDRLFALLNLSADEMALYESHLPDAEVRARCPPDLIVYLQARTEVLVDSEPSAGASRGDAPGTSEARDRSAGRVLVLHDRPVLDAPLC